MSEIWEGGLQFLHLCMGHFLSGRGRGLMGVF